MRNVQFPGVRRQEVNFETNFHIRDILYHEDHEGDKHASETGFGIQHN